MKKLLEEAYLAGFMAAGEGYNKEYPFESKGERPEDDIVWLNYRENAIFEIVKKSLYFKVPE